MSHDAIRHRIAVRQREDRLPRQPEVELHDQVTAVARHTPAARRLRLSTGGRQCGGDDLVRWIAHGGELATRGAATRLASRLELPEIRGAYVPAAVAARRPMSRARVLAADGTFVHAGERERLAVHVALLAVRRAAIGTLRVEQWLEVGDAVALLVLHALRRVAGADGLPARGARPDLIGREQRGRLLGAGGPVPRTDQASRAVGAAQVSRAVHLLIHDAHGLMLRADRLFAAGALRHLVHTHRLVCAALTVAQAGRAQ